MQYTEEPAVSAVPPIVDRAAWLEQIAELRTREKARTREGDAIAAARRLLPMVEVDASARLIGPIGEVTLLDAFEGRPQLFPSYHTCTSAVPPRTIARAARSTAGTCSSSATCARTASPTPSSAGARSRRATGTGSSWAGRCRGTRCPRNPATGLVAGRHFGMKCCYLRDGGRVFETYWTTARGCEPMGSSCAMLDMTVYGRQETFEDSPDGWPQGFDSSKPGDACRLNGRPISQWSRIAAGRSDDLGAA